MPTLAAMHDVVTVLPIELVLRDGTEAMIWPLLPTDAEDLRHAFDELSPRSRRLRFLGPVTRLDEAMIHLLVDAVDQRHHIALVLVVFPADELERPIGVARLVQLPGDPNTADFAVTVIDEWQGRGAGRALADALVQLRPDEVTTLATAVAADNAASLAMLRRLGAMTTRPSYPGVLEVVVHLPDAGTDA
ncbi:MAG TPA: GNAT family N-acetyltransferase [Mycobacteriales bacterium]|nr:GNAT family N-acetyltransferase [Mycobacteriales bacterium]